jgi:serine protease AprX
VFCLIDAQWDSQLPADARVVVRYPEFVLVETAAPPDLPGGAFEVLDDAAVHVHGVRVEIAAGTYEIGDTPRTIVRLAGPVAPAWVAQLRQHDVEVHFWCPRFGACVSLPAGMDADLLRESLPFVVGAQPYTEELCSRQLGALTSAQRRAAAMPAEVFDVVCFGSDARVRVERELRALGVTILASSSSKIRVHYTGDTAVLRDLVGVKLVDAARAVVPLAATLPAVLGLAGPDGGWDVRFTGRGQVVAVIDTGLDRGDAALVHSDFRGRVRSVRSWPLNPSWQPYVRMPNADDGPDDRSSGHGTHVAGLAVGSGAASAGRFRGVAPDAELVFEAIEQYTDVLPAHHGMIAPGYYLSGRPLDLRELFRSSAAAGAHVHVNAWGDPAQGRYTDDCYETDLFLHGSQDHVIVFAAGNDGADRNGDGVADPGSVYAPASAKNVLAVGATEGGDIGVGNRGTWGDLDPRSERYRHAATRAAGVSGAPGCLAPCSSTGPTRDGRVKPDVCAPGTNLAAPRSALSRRAGWGLASPLPHYMYNGGTSMAAGLAGGFLALLRQAWQEHLGHAPTGVALKALAILGAAPVRQRGTDRPESRHNAGFGRIQFAGSAPALSGRVVFLHDCASDPLSTGGARRFSLSLGVAGRVRAVLAWYDAPGETLVNDLDLALLAADGTVTWGNHDAASHGTPDRSNTVEVIDLDLPAGGHTIRITAANVPTGAQPFALVVAAPAGSQCEAAVGPGGAPLQPTPPEPILPEPPPEPAPPEPILAEPPPEPAPPEPILAEPQPEPSEPILPEPPPPEPPEPITLEDVAGLAASAAARLRAAGVPTLQALLALAPAQLGGGSGLEGLALAALAARLELIRRVAAQPLPPIPADATLADALRPAAPAPAGVDPADWTSLRAVLLPLVLVIEPARLASVQLDDLGAFLPTLTR